MEIKSDKIRAVFFDLGKVILTFNHHEIVARFLKNVAPEMRRESELFEFLFDEKDGLCNPFDEGNISARGFFEVIDSRFNLNMGFDEFKDAWNDIFTESEPVSELMREVRRRRPVYLLSNVNELHWEFVRERYPVLSEVDGWVLSYELKVKKPAPAIYEHALKTAGIGAGESIFIDDLEKNTIASTKCGIPGVTFIDHASLRSILKSLMLVD